jgi:hypothetical protein
MNREPNAGNFEGMALPRNLLPLTLILRTCATPQSACTVLAELFQVHSTEVGLLRLEHNVLCFLYPEHLRSTGAIPISSSAVAAHTALSKKAEIFNNFALVKHASIFETIRPCDADHNNQQVPLPIQKLMSVPILRYGESTVCGVVQISHKGVDPRLTQDFTREELHDLERAAELLATAPFLVS